MRRLLVVLVLAVTLALPAGVGAATLDDIRALGYELHIQFETDTCRAWTVVGFGVNSSLGCEGTPDFQAAVDSIANPEVHYERRWQHEHPDQLQAAQALAGGCYAVNRAAPMTDAWRIVATGVDLTAVGADLPTLAATLPDLRIDGACPAGTGGSTIVPGTSSDGTVIVPGSPAALALSQEAALASLRAAGYEADYTAEYGIGVRPARADRFIAL